MLRSSISARLASLGAATLLIAGLSASAVPALAASPRHVALAHQVVPDRTVQPGRSGTANVRKLSLEPKKKLSIDSKAVSSTLAKAEAKIGRTKAAGGIQPDVVGPPDPDPVTSSGAPAASTPVSVAGHTGTTTADPSIAVGPDETLEADTTGLEIRDRAGNSLAAALDLPTFFALPESPFTTFFADPEVMFDSVHQRWIVSELSWDCATATYTGDTASFGHGYIDYAVSDTPDPLGVWTFSGFVWPDSLPDRPSVGTSTDKLALTTSLIAMGAGGSPTTPGCASGALTGAEAVVVDWASLSPAFSLPPYAAFALDGLDALRVAVSQPAVDSDLRMIGLANGSESPSVAGDVWYVDVAGSAVHGTITEPVIDDLTVDGIIPGFGTPAAPSQSGGGGILTTPISGAPESLIYGAGQLAFTSTLPCIPTGDSLTRDCVRVTTLASSTPTAEPTRVGDVLLGSNGFDNTFGGLNWSTNGNLFAVYTQSSGATFASSVAQYHLGTTADQTAWSDPQTLSSGAGTYTGTGWGDYLGVATDPQVPGAVWVGDPAAEADGSWATTVHELSVGDVGAGYVPVTPTRFLDTRVGNGLSSPFTANVPQTFLIGGASRTPAGGPTVSIPSNAVAITGNLTVTQQTAAGSVSLTPTPTANPLSSTINFPLGDNRANNITIALGPGGHLSAVYKAASGKHTALILDVTGYFLAGSGQTYTPLTPTRFMDSRAGTGHRGPPTFQANVAQRIPIGGVTFDTVTVPSNATAITANLTVTGQTKVGSVTLTPTPNNAPTTSTINFPVGDTRANGVTIQLDPLTGDIAAVYVAAHGATANLVLDVTGYYSTTGGAGLLFHPLNPGRRIDTRLPLGGVPDAPGFGNGLTGAQATTPRSTTVAAHDGVPAAAAAVTGNLTITGQTALGYVAITASSIAHPTTSTINFPLGDTRANGITVPLGGSGELWFVYGNAIGKHVQLVLDLTGYFQ